jgi:DNA-binding beta-propeller fold protein YncE
MSSAPQLGAPGAVQPTVARRIAFLLLAAVLVPAAIGSPAHAAPGLLRAFGSEGRGPGQFTLPDGIEVDAAGTIWVADREANRILRFSNTGNQRPFAPFRRRHFSKRPGRFRLPYDIDVDGLGNIFVADKRNNRIQMFSPKGRFVRMWGRGGGNGRSGRRFGEFDEPRGVEVDPFGNVWVADHQNRRVQKFTHEGRFLLSVGADGGKGGVGTAPGEWNAPRGLSADAAGNVYVADDANHRVVKLSNDGTPLASWGRDGGGYDRFGNPRLGTGPGEFNFPYGTAIDPRGHVWVADTRNNRVEELTTDGAWVRHWGAHGGDGTAGEGPLEFDEPYNVATDCVGNVYVTDEENHRVQVIGDPAYGRPVCPPRVTVPEDGLALSQRRAAVTATCDRACHLSARFTITRAGAPKLRLEGRRLDLLRGGTRTIAVAIPAGGEVRRMAVRVTAAGPPGAKRSLKRSLAAGGRTAY